MESQAHGVVFENALIESLTGMSKDMYQKTLTGGYTSALDLEKGPHVPYNASVKTCGGNGIGCGDILRFYEHCHHTDFRMIVGRWEQVSSDVKRFHEILEFDMNKSGALVFGNVPYFILKEFDSYVKNIPPGKEAQLAHRSIWKEKRAKIMSDWNTGLIAIDAKIDSKKQRRVQCSLDIRSMKKVLSWKESELVEPFEITSGSRKFLTKN